MARPPTATMVERPIVTRNASSAAVVATAGAGSATMAVTSWWCGALPLGWHSSPVASVVFYLGLVAVLFAWLDLGRAVLRGRDVYSSLVGYVVAVAVPLMGAMPFGRDLWAYAAQGNLARHGLNPYTHGPSAWPSTFTDQVSPRWVTSPSPYGPIWLRLSHLAVDLSSGQPLAAALLLRLPALLGIGLSLWALPRLASRLAGTLTAGIWLGLASPLTLVLGVGGGHNDVLMLGLILAGCALATGRGERVLALGAAVVAIGVLVKSPAAIGVAFTVPFWMHANGVERTVRSVVRACLVAAMSAGVVIVGASLACGLGNGWLSQVNSDAQWISWLSLPCALVLLGRGVGGLHPIKKLDATLRGFRTGAMGLTIVVVLALWSLALARLRDGRTQLGCLAAALGAAALFAPSVQPWYYCWGLALAGFVVVRRWVLIVLIAVGAGFPVMIAPSGYGMESSWYAFPVVAGALIVAAALSYGRLPLPSLLDRDVSPINSQR